MEKVINTELNWCETPPTPPYILDVKDRTTRKVVGSRLITEEGETKELAEAIKELFPDSQLGEKEIREIQGIILDNVERVENNKGIRPERPRELLPAWVQSIPYAIQVQSSLSNRIGIINSYLGFYPDTQDLIDIANIIFTNVTVVITDKWLQENTRGGK